MDKDNRDDFTFAKLSDLKLPLTFRMYVRILACSKLLKPNGYLIQLTTRRNKATKVSLGCTGEPRTEVPWRSIPVRLSATSRVPSLRPD